MLTLFPLLLLVTFGMCEEDVRFAAVIYRHGDRTPVEPYPTDPWKDESNWPVAFGQLTNEGKRQHYAFGQWLRRRYAHVLSANFDTTQIYVRSSDVDRTLMSAQVNLAGMYPPNEKSLWDNDLKWQPIPVHTVPEEEDNVVAMVKHCPAYDEEYENVKHTKNYTYGLSHYHELMSYLTIHSGMEVKDYEDINFIYNTLTIESLYNFTLPTWTDPVFPDKMREPACYSFVTPTINAILGKLKAGPILEEVLNSMKSTISFESMDKNNTMRRLAIYSGHDYTIANILNALGMFDHDCPTYTAAIFFELLKVDGKYVIRISYRNSIEIVEPRVLSIPNCGETCPVERFTELYNYLLTVKWDFECANQFSPLLGVSFLVGLAIFFTMYIIHKLHFSSGLHNNGALGYQIFRSQTLAKSPSEAC